ncbi:MAG TPA: hypothetical protein VME40_14620 [Caulobacteraceae bacterium]|nr:hypothetical protein [Caulobacteraceae bacterium]
MIRPILAPAALTLAAIVALGLDACKPRLQPPGEAGVCYHLAVDRNGATHFNVVAKGVPDMEHCAAALEGMRLRFLSIGGSSTEIVGAYQGNFLFLQDEGVFTSDSIDGARYPFLVHSGNQLVPPGQAGP